MNSIHGSKFDNISIAINLLIEAKIKILKKFQIIMKLLLIQIKNLPKFLNVGLLVYKKKYFTHYLKK